MAPRPTILRTAILIAICSIAAVASPLQVIMADPFADFGPKVKRPCPRGDANDVCSVVAYCMTGPGAARDNTHWIYRGAWDAGNASLPANFKWTLVDGGALAGKLAITKFRAYNDCSGPGGVEVEAKFTPAGNDPRSWKWSQG